MLVLSLGAIGAIVALQDRAAASGHARVRVAQLKHYLGQALMGAWNAKPDVGGDPVVARHILDAGEQGFNRTFAQLDHDSPRRVVDQIPPLLRTEYGADERVYELGSTRGYGEWINHLTVPQTASMNKIFSLLDRAAHQYTEDAHEAHVLATIGTAAAILLLMTGFLAMYRRATRLAALNRRDAVTDALTGLANRRALIDDLLAAFEHAPDAAPFTRAMFDLDCFDLDCFKR